MASRVVKSDMLKIQASVGPIQVIAFVEGSRGILNLLHEHWKIRIEHLEDAKMLHQLLGEVIEELDKLTD